MEVKEYQKIIDETAVYPEDIGLIYCALGLVNEAGEVAGKVKKLIRDHTELYESIKAGVFKDEELEKWMQLRLAILQELGDVQWYLTATAQTLDSSLSDVLQLNYDKLMGRKERGTIQGNGDNR